MCLGTRRAKKKLAFQLFSDGFSEPVSHPVTQDKQLILAMTISPVTRDGRIEWNATVSHSTKYFIPFCLSNLCGFNSLKFVSNNAVLIEIFKDRLSILYFNLGHIYFVVLLNILYHFVRLIRVVLTHPNLSKTVHYWLIYLWFTMPAEHLSVAIKTIPFRKLRENLQNSLIKS